MTSTLQADVDDLGFEDFALKKHIASEEVTAKLHAEETGFATVIAQLDAIRAMAKAPIVQEVKLRIDKSSLAALGAEEAAVAAVNGNGGSNGNGNGNGAGAFLGGLLSGRNGSKGVLPTLAWGNHGGGRSALPWWGRLLMGGGALAGVGSLGSFAGFGAEHFLTTGLGVAGSAGAGLLGGGLLGAGALGTMAVGGGSDMAVMKSTISDTSELGKLYAKLQEQVALYGAHSKEAARASAQLHLAMREMGPAAKPELALAKSAEALDSFWDHQTQKARANAAHVLQQVVGLGRDYVPLVAHAAERNLAIINKDLKPLFSWLEGPEGTGIFEHLESEFAHNLPTAMHATDQGVQLVLKTINVASEYTGGFIHTVDEFFTKWNEPQNFQKWEAEIGHLVGDFHLWMNLIKALGTDIFDLFSQDAGTGKAIVVTITEMLHHLDEWERSTEGKAELHNLFVVHREEILQLLHVIPPLIGAISPIYMTVAPFMTEAMTEVLGAVADFLKLLDKTGPVTRWALGLGLIATKLFGFKALFAPLGKAMWSPFESLLAKDPLVGRFFEEKVAETDGLTAATEGLTTAVGGLTAAYEAMGAAATTAGEEAATAAADAQMSLFAETTAAEGAAAEAAQMSLFPMGAGLAPATVEKGAASTAGTAAAEDAAAGAAGGLLTGAGSRLKAFADAAAGSIFAKAGAVAAGYFAAEFGAKLIAPGALEGQNLEQALLHGFNTKEVAQTEARGLADAFQRELNIALRKSSARSIFNASANRGVKIPAERRQAIVDESQVLGRLKSGYVVELIQIKKLLRRGSEEAAVAFGEGSPEYRAAAADNMHAAIEAIKAGEKTGYITVEEGQKEIASLLHSTRLVTGNDPFGIARSFVRSWEEVGGANRSGIAAAISEMSRMPPAMRDIAVRMELEQIRHAEQTGNLTKGSYARMRSAVVTDFGVMALKAGKEAEALGVNVVGPFGKMNSLVAEALEDIGGNVSQVLAALGAAKLPAFHLKNHGVNKGLTKADQTAFEAFGHQTGGFTVPGNSTGDQHPYLLPHESFIMNRRATAAYGLQQGGMSPVLLESGERVFLPHEVKALGAHKLERVNGDVPRFQKGGMHGLGPEPHLQGQRGPLLDLGQQAIHSGYMAAQHYLGAHQPHGGVTAYIPGGGGPVVAQMGHVLLADGFNRIGAAGPIGNAWRESRWDPAAVGTGGGGLFGFTSGAISLAALQAAAKRAGVPWTDVGFQVAFMLRHGGDALRPRLNAARSPEESARIFMEEWERPGIPALGEREAGARKAFAMGYQRGGLLSPSDYLARKWAGWGETGHYNPLRRGEGGLIEREEHALGVPGSHHKPHEHATASDAVHWAMRHLGDSDQWGYPGEWCGAFIAADMKAQGLPVPSGYPAAASWASYGTPLGNNHIQAGAILDYGSAHVALAISSSEQIQGNDIHGQVGTSGIGGVIGGSPLTAVRWPPYGTGPGAGAKPTEPPMPGVFKDAHTHSLSLPRPPKTLHAIDREVHRWSRELHVYEAAVKAAEQAVKRGSQPRELPHKLQANVTKIQKYLRELERARHKLRTQAARSRYSGHLGKQLGSVTGEEKTIELAQRAYNAASQRAEQVVDLEPTERILSAEASEADRRKAQEDYAHAFEAYVEGQERPAFAHVLETEAAWRNTILGAEVKATGMETGWEGQIRGKMAEIASIQHFSDEAVKERERVLGQIREFKHDHPKAELPKDLRGARDKMQRDLHTRSDLLERLPGLRFQERELRKVLGEGRAEFWGGYESPGGGRGAKAPAYLDAALADRAVQPPAPPLPGTGTFEQSLEEVQGLHWPGQHERLASLPSQRAVGAFGGAIWDTQSSIEELGLKVQQAAASVAGLGTAGGAGGGTSERDHLLEELLLQAREREAVGEIERQTLHGVRLMPYAGGYEAGGTVAALVGEQGPEIVETRPGAYIRNAAETSSLLSPKVEVHYYEGEKRAEVKVNGKPIDRSDVEEIVHSLNRHGARLAGRGLARAGS